MLWFCFRPTLSAAHFSHSVNYLSFWLRRQYYRREIHRRCAVLPVTERRSSRVITYNSIIVLRTIAAQLPIICNVCLNRELLVAATGSRIIAGFAVYFDI